MATDRRYNDPFGEPDQATSSRWRWPVTLPIVTIVLILAVMAFVGLRPEEKVAGPDYCDGPDGGLVRMGGECIGVTDGSYVLPGLAREEQLIRQQNAAIKGQRSVTVAVFDPLTPDATSALDIDEIRHQVQGAIVAQQWVNQDAIGINGVRIRLVLANQGSHQQSWQPVVEQLHHMQDDLSPLVATVGMGVSVQQTLDAARALSGYDIPSVGAITTADALNQSEASGFFRVSPSTRDYAEALKPWAAGFASGLLVYDSASEDARHPDIFTRSMRDNFRAGFKGLNLAAVNYHGSENSTDVQANRFGLIREKICNEHVPLVLFAGRRNDLGRFVQALQGRGCTEHVTVMVGGTNLGGLAKSEDLAKAGISLVWSSGTNVEAWLKGKGTPENFGRFLTAYQKAFPTGDLADGEAVAGYDALLAVATAANQVDYQGENPSPDVLPSGKDIRSALLNTEELGKIHAASGELSYTNRGPVLSGDPIGKPIPVLQQGIAVPVPPDDLYVTTNQ